MSLLLNAFRLSDALVIFIILGFMAFVPILIGFIVFWTLRKNSLARAEWQKLSSELGFHMRNPKQLEMTGEILGMRTKLSIGSRRVSSGEDSYTEFFTYCESYFPRDLRFALEIKSPNGFLDNVFNSSDIRIGNEKFDKVFSVMCYDPQVVQRLLLSDFPSAKTGNLMGDLMLASESFYTIKLYDHKLYIETDGQERNPQVLKKLLSTTNGVASRFKEARELFPPMEWEKQLSTNWAGFAAEHGLNYDNINCRIGGTYKGFPVSATVHCVPGKWMTTLEVRYPQPLLIGLNIYPELAIHKAVKLFGFQDIKSGETDFDKAYIVKGKNVEAAKSKLSPEFCKQMVALDKLTHAISLTDEEMKMTLNQVLGDTKLLKSYLEGMISAMRKLQ